MQESKFVYVAGFGVDKRLLLSVSKNIKEVFGLEVRFSQISMPPKYGYNEERDQYHAGTLLEYLSKVYYPHMLKLVAILSYDLYENGLNFIFGLAKLGGGHALVSTYRLWDTDERLFFERVSKEVNHELGHTFGLLHCKNPGCVMNFSNSLYEVDLKGRFFCERCRSLLKY